MQVAVTSHERLNNLLVEIGERVGLPLQLDELGSCAIKYDEISEVILTGCSRDESVLLHLPIVFLCEKRSLEHLRHCLELSLFGADTNGGAVSLDPDTNGIIFWRRMSLDALDSQALERAFVAFIAAADRFRTDLSARHERSRKNNDACEATTAFAMHATHISI